MPEFECKGDAVSCWLRVKPRAQRDRLKTGSSGELVLEVHAPPVEGEANDACVRFFARALKIPQSAATIVAGHKSRRKLVRITGRSGEETMAQIQTLANGQTSGRTH